MRRPSSTTMLRLAAAAWVVPRIVRVALAARPSEPLGEPRHGSVDDISVVIPARDEATRIGPLLEVLVGRYEVIVVDDGSSDGTAETARNRGATVVAAGDRPAGWAAKTWALRRGVEAANGTWVVHIDADVRVAVDVPLDIVAAAERLGADLVSVATRVVAPPSARWLHASMLASLVYRLGGPGALESGRELANGQVLAARRASLVGPDGWSAVRGHVTEDVALARHLAASGGRVVMIDGDAEIEFGSFGEVRRGWGRSIGLPGIEPSWRSSVDVAALALTMPWPLMRLTTRRADLLDVALLAARWGTAVGVGRAYRSAGPAVWASPLADPLTVVLVAGSAFRRSVRWRGRRLPVPRAPLARTGSPRTS